MSESYKAEKIEVICAGGRGQGHISVNSGGSALTQFCQLDSGLPTPAQVLITELDHWPVWTLETGLLHVARPSFTDLIDPSVLPTLTIAPEGFHEASGPGTPAQSPGEAGEGLKEEVNPTIGSQFCSEVRTIVSPFCKISWSDKL